MSRLKLGKKLQPAKKAWKNFSYTLQSKVHKLNIPKTIKTTLQRILSTLHSLRYLLPGNRNRRPLATRRRPYTSSYYHVHGKNFSAIRIDDLFAEPAASSSVFVQNNNKTHHAQGETSKGKEVLGEKDLPAGGSSGMDTIEDAWKAVVAKSPQLQVDQKAEDFINKFHEDMKLQKERSLLEFQEMLDRSA